MLVSCKSISQTIIPKNSIVLTEKQAKAVVKDLIKYDALKKVVVLQDERINNFTKKEKLFGEQLAIKDTIISKQTNIIDEQNTIINSMNRIKLHGYIGMLTEEVSLKQPVLRGNIMVEYKKISAGAVYTIQQNSPHTWGVLIQYKLF